MAAEFGYHFIAGQWLSDAPNGSSGLAENAVMAAREAFDSTD